MESENHYILKHLDNPIRILFWDTGEFMFLALPFFAGILLSSVLVIVLGILLFPFYKRFKRRFQRGHLIALTYWNLPYTALKHTKRWKKIPPSYLSELVL
jgi:type IV conjugative transfer system protein TraL